jgi:pyruvate/2-oxoglutarate dehydrogenase complex dihydrolipoamide dehydrogenase (E3) component
MAPTYDLIVLGGGSAGLTASVMSAGLGARTLLVERHKLGGDCLNTGCIPSKALIRSANVAALAGRHAADLYWREKASKTLVRWLQRIFGYTGTLPGR